jgi:choline dehydrogenase-like flavoprotein
MASFDYDVVIIGSGFGGSVVALHAAEKGYRVGVMESGRRETCEPSVMISRRLLAGHSIRHSLPWAHRPHPRESA